MKTYIAIDIGASSGRLMKSELIDGQLTLTEVHRFKNGFRCWMVFNVGILTI